MSKFILAGSQRGRSDAEYLEAVTHSFQGRIPYSHSVYAETAFQWLGPAAIIFRRSLDPLTCIARVYMLSIDGSVFATKCVIGDSWGYHKGTAWHRVRPDAMDLESFESFRSDPRNAKVLDQYFVRKDGFVTDRGRYMALTRKVWQERTTQNLKMFVSFEENELFESLRRRVSGA